jgi:hypothetical protein
VSDPEGDILAMDRHVAHLEEITGLRLRAKIYWARGQLLGRGGLCIFGIVMGSDESPVGHLDRHELAHAIEHQHGSAARDSPTLLAEGWAESQSADAVTLAGHALRFRQQRASRDGPTVCYLRLLTDSFWYHRHGGAVYSVGGAFVDFLIRHYGAMRFIDFYFACRPGTLEAEAQRVYGTDLESLEKGFWADAERLAGSQ